MKILVLLNNAPIAPMLKDVALELNRRGFDVSIATDSDYTKQLRRLDEMGLDCYSFAKFHEQSIKESDAPGASEGIDNWLLYADYDRSSYYGFSSVFRGEGANRISKDLFKFFDQIIKKRGITEVFYENVSNAFAESACRAVERNGGRYHGFTASRIPGMATFSRLDSDIRETIDRYMACPDMLEDELPWADKYLSNLRETEPDYMKTNGLADVGLWKKTFRVRKLRNTFLLLKYSRTRHSRFQMQFGRPIVSGLLSNLRLVKRRIRVPQVRKLYSDPPEGKELFLYPLHYHPEASTSILARYYDELNVIRNIVFSLRDDEWLVVKDHMSAMGFEKMSLYRQIASLPNVTFLRPEVNAKAFIAECSGVITLTSTLGYEAALLGKPVAIFGEPFYAGHPLVKKIWSFHELRDGLDHLKKRFEERDYYDYSRRFMAAYRKACFNLRPKTRDEEAADEAKYLAIADELITRLDHVSTEAGSQTIRLTHHEQREIAEYRY